MDGCPAEGVAQLFLPAWIELVVTEAAEAIRGSFAATPQRHDRRAHRRVLVTRQIDEQTSRDLDARREVEPVDVVDRPSGSGLFRQAMPLAAGVPVAGDRFRPVAAAQADVAANDRALEPVEPAEPGRKRRVAGRRPGIAGEAFVEGRLTRGGGRRERDREEAVLDPGQRAQPVADLDLGRDSPPLAVSLLRERGRPGVWRSDQRLQDAIERRLALVRQFRERGDALGVVEVRRREQIHPVQVQQRGEHPGALDVLGRIVVGEGREVLHDLGGRVAEQLAGVVEPAPLHVRQQARMIGEDDTIQLAQRRDEQRRVSGKPVGIGQRRGQAPRGRPNRVADLLQVDVPHFARRALERVVGAADARQRVSGCGRVNGVGHGAAPSVVGGHWRGRRGGARPEWLPARTPRRCPRCLGTWRPTRRSPPARGRWRAGSRQRRRRGCPAA